MMYMGYHFISFFDFYFLAKYSAFSMNIFSLLTSLVADLYEISM